MSWVKRCTKNFCTNENNIYSDIDTQLNLINNDGFKIQGKRLKLRFHFYNHLRRSYCDVSLYYKMNSLLYGYSAFFNSMV